jgi:hypothetical protein
MVHAKRVGPIESPSSRARDRFLNAAIPAPGLPTVNAVGFHTWSHVLLSHTNVTNLTMSKTDVAAGGRCRSHIRTGHLNPDGIDSCAGLILVGFRRLAQPSRFSSGSTALLNGVDE